MSSTKERYKDLTGNSGILSYEIGDDFIIIEFKNHSIYRYDSKSAGVKNIIKMKALALTGKGLSTFISRYVKNNYSAQIK